MLISLLLSQKKFKSIVDDYTPKDWKAACASNLDKPVFPAVSEPPEGC